MKIFTTIGTTANVALKTIDKGIGLVDAALNPTTNIVLDIFSIVENNTQQMSEEAVMDNVMYKANRLENIDKKYHKEINDRLNLRNRL